MNDSSNRIKKVGLPPGSIIYTGENPQHKIHIDILAYNDSVTKGSFLMKVVIYLR